MKSENGKYIDQGIIAALAVLLVGIGLGMALAQMFLK
jgi:hypothetical protein